MNEIKYKFSKTDSKVFGKEVNARVNELFVKENITHLANRGMILKTLLSFGFYMGIYLLIILGGVENLLALLVLWVLLGFGQGFVGMCIMHDKVHGAYVKSFWGNILLEIPIVSIGVESLIWKIEHNIMHHNYTNIDGLDQDIYNRGVFRFSKHHPRRWYHRYQHIYATFFYSLMIMEWMTVKDFLKLVKYKKMGFFKTNPEAIQRALIIIAKKSVFFTLFLVIPLYVIDRPAELVSLMFLTMLAVAGIYMTIIFQLAHVVPHTYFPETEENNGENWHIHQMKTTSNFANNNRFITFILGGLNYQIEHHIQPGMCHVHYPKISKIVKSTAAEFGIPYYTYRSVWEAISMHYGLLRKLGRP